MEEIENESLPLYETEHKGIFFEPTVYENKKNLPEDYIPLLYNLYDREMAERYIFGRRTSLSGNKILYSYSDHLHRTGIMSALLCHYDPALEIILSIDFNVAPMSATLWQKKWWNDKWNDGYINKQTGKFEVWDEGKVVVYNAPREYAAPDREVLAQIDEFEVWEGGTEGLMKRFEDAYVNKQVMRAPSLERYGPKDRCVYHRNGVTVLGDATGNRLYTSADKTDWQIIRKACLTIPSITTIQGLISNSNYKTGEVKYSNPPVRATINTLNASLRDAAGRVWMCFKPQSAFASGGAARSCAMMIKTGDGRVDESQDKREAVERDAPRTHFFDTVRYVAYWFRGTESGMTPEEFETAARSLNNENVSRTDSSEFDTPIFGDSWGGIFG